MTKTEIRNNFLKNLMIGMLYPAVLGNIIYIILTVIENQSKYGSGYNFNFKVAYLIITALFYFCDYLYIYFTNKFKWWMFILDLFFVIFLFLTYQKLHLTTTEKGKSPEVLSILYFYLLFIFLYFIWDKTENNTSESDGEKKMYNSILNWEYFSFVLLLINIVLHYFDNFLSEYKDYISIFSIAIITILFFIIDILKYKIWAENELLKSKQQCDEKNH